MRHGNFTDSSYNEFWILVTLFPISTYYLFFVISNTIALRKIMVKIGPRCFTKIQS